jgi:hypothetical protein
MLDMRSEIAIAQLAEPKSLFDGPPQIGKRCHKNVLSDSGAAQQEFSQRRNGPALYFSASAT